MSKESSIKVICWSLKYARTCFSARLGDPHVLPEAEQMKAPVGRGGSAGRAFHSRIGTSSGWESQRPTRKQLPAFYLESRTLGLSCPGIERALLFRKQTRKAGTRRGSDVDGTASPYPRHSPPVWPLHS